MSGKLRAYYAENPLMVSSPFGGVDGLNEELFSSVLRQLSIDLEGLRVLDVGCGRGFLAHFVAKCGGDYTGVDFVVSRTGFRFALADAALLPFPSMAFDAVFCIDAFEHFPDPVAAAREFHRVLRPGGFTFLSVPNYAKVAGLVKLWAESLGRFEKNTWAPFRNWQPQEFEHFTTGRSVRRAFRRAGFFGFQSIGHAAEVGLGIFPWIEHPKMPEAVKFRLQRLFNWLGPAVVKLWPSASLHGFWKIEP